MSFIPTSNISFTYGDPGTYAVGLVVWDSSGRSAHDEVLLTVADLLSGDVNGDGWVGGDDLTIILENWGQFVTDREQGDLNGDGFIGGDDYTEVLTYWGTGTAPEATSAPEPATIVMLGLLVPLLLPRRRRT